MSLRFQNYNEWAKITGFDIIVTAGVPTESGPPKGALAVDKTNGKLYQNTGTATMAIWTLFEAGAGSIVNADVAAAAAIAWSKMAALTDAHILVGSALNVATDVAMSGDATLANTGALTIANLAVTAGKLAATLDLSGKTVTLAEAAKQATVSALSINVMDSADPKVDGMGLYLRYEEKTTNAITLVAESPSEGTSYFESADNSYIVPVFYQVSEDDDIEITDDDSAASNGVAVYIRPLYTEHPIEKHLARMEFVSPTDALGIGSINNGSDTYVILDNDGAASALLGIPSFQLYFDEDAANEDERFLVNNTLGGDDLWLQTANGRYFKVMHDADAATNGVAVYFDEDAANTFERLLFVSPTDTDGVCETDQWGGLYDVEGIILKELYIDEATSTFMYEIATGLDFQIRLINKSNVGDRVFVVEASADPGGGGAVEVYFDDDAVALDERLLADLTTDVAAPASDTFRMEEIVKAA